MKQSWWATKPQPRGPYWVPRANASSSTGPAFISVENRYGSRAPERPEVELKAFWGKTKLTGAGISSHTG